MDMDFILTVQILNLKNNITHTACILMQAQIVDKALLLQGFAIVGTAFLI